MAVGQPHEILRRFAERFGLPVGFVPLANHFQQPADHRQNFPAAFGIGELRFDDAELQRGVGHLPVSGQRLHFVRASAAALVNLSQPRADIGQLLLPLVPAAFDVAAFGFEHVADASSVNWLASVV